MWEEADFLALENFCMVANEEEFQVWATLIGPSGCAAIANLSPAEQEAHYLNTVQRFAQIANGHSSFIGYTCDDFVYNYNLFTKDFVTQMSSATRAIAPDFVFLPLMYYSGALQVFDRYGDSIDGVVFHFRCGSNPSTYIPGYDPANFDHYRHCMRYEVNEVRKQADTAGGKAVIVGFYNCYNGWWYEGWGVSYPGQQHAPVSHYVEDAELKLTVAHEGADGVRVYGAGQNHDTYTAMGSLLLGWGAEGKEWGWAKDQLPDRGEIWLPIGNPPHLRVFGDVNNNGKENVVVTRDEGMAVYEENDSGVWRQIKYIDPTGTALVSDIAIGDTDGDGKKEIIYGTRQSSDNGQRVYLYEHTSGNDFVPVGLIGPYANSSGVRYLNIIDANADGVDELIVTHAYGGYHYVRIYSSPANNSWIEV